jgi:SAM-dependent methyltransferase
MGFTRAGDDMRRSFYDGATLYVRIYDSINHSDRPVVRGDIAFHCSLAQRANGEVLEIDVGTGRVAVELAKAGIRLTSLDLSEAMLAIDLPLGDAASVAACRVYCRSRVQRFSGVAAGLWQGADLDRA